MLNEYIEYDQYTKYLQSSKRFGNAFENGEFNGYERAVQVIVRGFLYGHDKNNSGEALIKEGESLSRDKADELLRCSTRFVQAWLGKWRKEWYVGLIRGKGKKPVAEDVVPEDLKWEKIEPEEFEKRKAWKSKVFHFDEIQSCLGKVFVELPDSRETLEDAGRYDAVLRACQKAFPKVCLRPCDDDDRRRKEILQFHNPQLPYDMNSVGEYLKGVDGEAPNTVARLLCDVRKEVEESPESKKKQEKLDAVDGLIEGLGFRSRGLSTSMMTKSIEKGDNNLKTLYMEKMLQQALQIGPLKNYVLHQEKPGDPLENVKLCYLDHTIDIEPESAGGQFIFRTLAAYLKAQKEQEGPVASEYLTVNISDLKNWGGTKKYSKKIPGSQKSVILELPKFLSLLRYNENGQKYQLFESQVISQNVKKMKVDKRWIDKYGFALAERQNGKYFDLDYVDNGRGDRFIRQDLKQELAAQQNAKIAEKELQALKQRIKGDYTLKGEESFANHNPGDMVSFKRSTCNMLSRKDKYSVESDQSGNYLVIESASDGNDTRFELEFLPDGNLMLRKDNETILLQPTD